MSTELTTVNLENSTVVAPGSLSDNTNSIPSTAWVQALVAAQTTGTQAANGWVRLSNGLIIQWGQTGVLPDSTQQLVTFPLMFPNHVYAILATMSNNIGANVRTMQCTLVNNATFNIQANGSSSQAFWIAIGN